MTILGVTFNDDSQSFKAGFTLFELLVVIAILGTIVGLALPSFKMPEDNGQTLLLEIQKPLEKWRNLAMSTGETLKVSVNGGSKKLELYGENLPKEEEFIGEAEKDEPHEVAEVSGKFFITTVVDADIQEGEILLMPDGTVEPFEVYRTKDDKKRLVYNGTFLVGRLLEREVEE